MCLSRWSDICHSVLGLGILLFPILGTLLVCRCLCNFIKIESWFGKYFIQFYIVSTDSIIHSLFEDMILDRSDFDNLLLLPSPQTLFLVKTLFTGTCIWISICAKNKSIFSWVFPSSPYEYNIVRQMIVSYCFSCAQLMRSPSFHFRSLGSVSQDKWKYLRLQFNIFLASSFWFGTSINLCSHFLLTCFRVQIWVLIMLKRLIITLLIII